MIHGSFVNTKIEDARNAQDSSQRQAYLQSLRDYRLLIRNNFLDINL